MNKEPLLTLAGMGIVGYLTFHGHRFGKDCWLCNYRGMAFLTGSLVLGIWVAFSENANEEPTYHAYYRAEDSEEE